MLPLGDRILVKPDAQPERSDDGILLPQEHDHVPVSGVIVALGPGGSAIRCRVRQRAIRDCLEILESSIRTFGPLSALQIAREEMGGMLGSSDPERVLHIGDRVVFPAEVGLSVTEDGEAFIILNEDDVAAIDAAEVAA